MFILLVTLNKYYLYILIFLKFQYFSYPPLWFECIFCKKHKLTNVQPTQEQLLIFFQYLYDGPFINFLKILFKQLKKISPYCE